MASSAASRSSSALATAFFLSARAAVSRPTASRTSWMAVVTSPSSSLISCSRAPSCPFTCASCALSSVVSAWEASSSDCRCWQASMAWWKRSWRSLSAAATAFRLASASSRPFASIAASSLAIASRASASLSCASSSSHWAPRAARPSSSSFWVASAATAAADDESCSCCSCSPRWFIMVVRTWMDFSCSAISAFFPIISWKAADWASWAWLFAFSSCTISFSSSSFSAMPASTSFRRF
mmetsp:Transcript_19480/g.58882  ORF Transcript_19480/g.58882 Transcript_19480/m.58882 type:complete len:239 (-) Transcript_19480:1247-1963(-)